MLTFFLMDGNWPDEKDVEHTVTQVLGQVCLFIVNRC